MGVTDLSSRQCVAVVMGGPSAEHAVSLASGFQVLHHLNRENYLPRAIVVTKDKMLYWCDCPVEAPSQKDLDNPAESTLFAGPVRPAAAAEIWEGVWVAFLALHGEFGEDGVIQGYLETLGIPYTGSGVFASAVGMNKIATKRLFESAGLDTPPYSVAGKHYPEITENLIIKRHGFPCYVKCPQSGSSRLMGQAKNAEELKSLLAEYECEADEILVESSVEGDEYSCPVVEYPDGRIEALAPILIRPKASSFFDYDAKYTDGASEEIVPAPCSEELTIRIQKTAIRAHQVLGCSGVSRTDIIHRDNKLQVLETNTLPGLTPTSLVPKSFTATGGTYSQLLDLLLTTADK